MAESNIQICPGCGGRNTSRAKACDWCGRSFSGRPRTVSVRWWQLTASILFGLAVVAVVGLAVLNATRPDARAGPAPTGGAAANPGVGSPTTVASTVAALPPPPTPTPTPRPPSPTPLPEPTATPAPRYVRVFNTGGIGLNLRKDPGPQGQPLTAVPDNTILRLVGPEETVQAQVWRLCEHEARGIQGWVPAQYIQATDQVPTPGRT